MALLLRDQILVAHRLERALHHLRASLIAIFFLQLLHFFLDDRQVSFAGLFRMSVSSSMSAFFSFSSSSIFFRSSAASVCKRISRIAVAWRSRQLEQLHQAPCASSLSFDFLIVAITRSIASSAIESPSRICARSCAFLRSNCVRRRTISLRCASTPRECRGAKGGAARCRSRARSCSC